MKTFSLSFNIKLSKINSMKKKLIEWVYREVEGYSRPEEHYEPI